MKPKLNDLQVKNYDKITGYVGRGNKRRPMVDWVTESEYISDKSLTIDEFDKIVLEHHKICGSCTYKKYRLRYGDGSVYYKHVLKEVMY